MTHFISECFVFSYLVSKSIEITTEIYKIIILRYSTGARTQVCHTQQTHRHNVYEHSTQENLDPRGKSNTLLQKIRNFISTT